MTALGAAQTVVLALSLSALAATTAVAQDCRGDCDADGRVTVAELVTAVNLALALRADLEVCASIDADGNARVAINELIGAVTEALAGCPVSSAAIGFCGESSQEVEARINDLLPQMTLAERVEQMHGLQLAPINDLYHTADNERLGIPGFRMVDGPRGVRAGHATAFPVGMARGATWDPALEERVGEAIGTETRAKGGSVILAPTINLLRHPRWGRAQETYGEDPLHLGTMGAAFIRGAQRQVIASAKHFALNSIENTRFNVSVSVDERTLREIYLPHFRLAVQEAHVGSVMSAYNKVNGQSCSQNGHLLREILKDDWGFKGFVESDWLVAVRSTVPSALAGLDIEMPMPRFYGDPLLAAVDSGAVPMRTINEAVRRILRTKLCFRLDTDPPQPNPALVESRAHTGLALEVAREAIVLLRNEGALLPLDDTTLSSLAVVGPLADRPNLGDLGSSTVSPSYVVTPLAGIRERAGSVTVTHVADAPLGEAEQTAIAGADAAIVVVGLTAADEGEGAPLNGIGGDRTMLGLPRDQDQLISTVAALNDHTIVVLIGGSAITMEGWVDEVEATLMAWYPGLEGGNAIAGVLFGDVNPSGKLPITFPRSADDLPAFINDRVEVTYDAYHGYRYVDRDGIEPLFPFGFGLSYTSYEYANLALSDTALPRDGTLEVTVDVTNTGRVAGGEIVQLYVSYDGSRVDRPVVDLKGFTRVSLDPDQTERVTLRLRAADLAFYDVGAPGWEVEPITYTVHVGPSSRDLPLQASFVVTD